MMTKTQRDEITRRILEQYQHDIELRGYTIARRLARMAAKEFNVQITGV